MSDAVREALRRANEHRHKARHERDPVLRRCYHAAANAALVVVRDEADTDARIARFKARMTELGITVVR